MYGEMLQRFCVTQHVIKNMTGSICCKMIETQNLRSITPYTMTCKMFIRNTHLLRNLLQNMFHNVW